MDFKQTFPFCLFVDLRFLVCFWVFYFYFYFYFIFDPYNKTHQTHRTHTCHWFDKYGTRGGYVVKYTTIGLSCVSNENDP